MDTREQSESLESENWSVWRKKATTKETPVKANENKRKKVESSENGSYKIKLKLKPPTIKPTDKNPENSSCEGMETDNPPTLSLVTSQPTPPTAENEYKETKIAPIFKKGIRKSKSVNQIVETEKPKQLKLKKILGTDFF